MLIRFSCCCFCLVVVTAAATFFGVASAAKVLDASAIITTAVLDATNYAYLFGLIVMAPSIISWCTIRSISLFPLSRQGPRGPEPLATAALSNLPHRLRRVRLSSLLALGECLARCESEAFRGAAPGLAQRLFDPAPEVRAGVARVAGKLLREWTYRFGGKTGNFIFERPRESI